MIMTRFSCILTVDRSSYSLVKILRSSKTAENKKDSVILVSGDDSAALICGDPEQQSYSTGIALCCAQR